MTNEKRNSPKNVSNMSAPFSLSTAYIDIVASLYKGMKEVKCDRKLRILCKWMKNYYDLTDSRSIHIDLDITIQEYYICRVFGKPHKHCIYMIYKFFYGSLYKTMWVFHSEGNYTTNITKFFKELVKSLPLRLEDMVTLVSLEEEVYGFTGKEVFTKDICKKSTDWTNRLIKFLIKVCEGDAARSQRIEVGQCYDYAQTNISKCTKTK